jgi:hypothetical protein
MVDLLLDMGEKNISELGSSNNSTLITIFLAAPQI